MISFAWIALPGRRSARGRSAACDGAARSMTAAKF